MAQILLDGTFRRYTLILCIALRNNPEFFLQDLNRAADPQQRLVQRRLLLLQLRCLGSPGGKFFFLTLPSVVVIVHAS